MGIRFGLLPKTGQQNACDDMPQRKVEYKTMTIPSESIGLKIWLVVHTLGRSTYCLTSFTEHFHSIRCAT